MKKSIAMMMLPFAGMCLAAVTGMAADQAGVIRVATFNIRCPVDKTTNLFCGDIELVP